MDELNTWRGPVQVQPYPGHTAAEDNNTDPAKSAHLLDIDLDFWGGAAGPLPPPWEIPPLQSCGNFFREHGAAAWADPRFGRHSHLWPSLLPPFVPLSAASQHELALRHSLAANGSKHPPSNRTLLDFCNDELTLYAHSSTEQQRKQLQLGHAAGLSVPEALVSVAPTHYLHPGQHCGVIDEHRLAEMLRHVRPRVVTIARSVDGYMPWRCAELLEASILRTLRLAFADRTLHIDYLPGTVSLDVLRSLL